MRPTYVTLSFAVGSALVVSSLAVAAFPTPQNAYVVQHLDLPGVSSPIWESHPAIDPLTGELYMATLGPASVPNVSPCLNLHSK